MRSYLSLLDGLAHAADLSAADRDSYLRAVADLRESYSEFLAGSEAFTNEAVIDEINRICGSDHSSFSVIID